MQKTLAFTVIFSLLLAPLISSYSFPEGFQGPGGCKSAEECMQYCKTHEDECKMFTPYQEEKYHASKEGKPSQSEIISGPGAQQVFPKAREKMMAYPLEGESKMMYPPQGQMIVQSYEMDATEMAMSGMFTRMKDMDPMHFKQYCPDAEKMVDAALAKLKEQGIELKAHCDDIQKHLEQCRQQQDKCENFKTNPLLDKQFLQCEKNQDTFFKECMEGVKDFAPGRNIEEQCEKQFQPMQEQCERNKPQQQTCDEAAFLKDCMTSQEQRCKSLVTKEQQEGCMQGNNCKGMWETKKHQCIQQPQKPCDKESFMKDCRDRIGKGHDIAKENQEERCKKQAQQLWQHAQENCKVGDQMHERCVKERAEQCKHMEQRASQCSSVTPEQMRKRMIEHARKMCEMMLKYKEGKGGMEGVMMGMMDMREKMPAEKRMMVEKEIEKLDQIHTSTQSQEKTENVFKKFFRLLGFFKEKEEKEVDQLKNNVQKLEESIQSLTALSEQVTDQNVKASLLSQIEKLKEEKTKIGTMVEGKEKDVKEALSGMFAKVFSR